MKATGIVRRIDDLGRVVIPKEIRRTMRIREGEPLEIYTNAGEVIFKKYSAVGEMSGIASHCAEALAENTSLPVIICDRDHCIAAAGISKKTVLEKSITPELEQLAEERKIYSCGGETQVNALSDTEYTVSALAPVLSGGDICGAVVLLNTEQTDRANATDLKLIGAVASFLGKQME